MALTDHGGHGPGAEVSHFVTIHGGCPQHLGNTQDQEAEAPPSAKDITTVQGPKVHFRQEIETPHFQCLHLVSTPLHKICHSLHSIPFP
jgi:hypothetical protein